MPEVYSVSVERVSGMSSAASLHVTGLKAFNFVSDARVAAATQMLPAGAMLMSHVEALHTPTQINQETPASNRWSSRTSEN